MVSDVLSQNASTQAEVCLVFKPSPLLVFFFFKDSCTSFTEKLPLKQYDVSDSSGLPRTVKCHRAIELSNKNDKGRGARGPQKTASPPR